MNYENIRYTVSDGVATITIDRPRVKNAMSLDTCKEMMDALRKSDDDSAVRVVVLTHTGKVFTAGGDLGGYRGKPYMKFRDYAFAFKELWTLMPELKKPIIAVAKGNVHGGGIGMIAACDMTVAASDVIFQCSEINIGLFPFMVTPLLIRQVGNKKALELMFTGNAIDAKEAKEIGLINHCVAPQEVDSLVKELTSTLANKSPSAMRMGKETLYNVIDMPYVQALEYTAQMLVLMTFSNDGQEGVNAFLEKRRPNYEGY